MRMSRRRIDTLAKLRRATANNTQKKGITSGLNQFIIKNAEGQPKTAPKVGSE